MQMQRAGYVLYRAVVARVVGFSIAGHILVSVILFSPRKNER